jgi:hypothetical protein
VKDQILQPCKTTGIIIVLYISIFVGLYSHYATIQKVMGSGPDEVDFSNLPDPSGHTVALGSTQPLTEMSTRNLRKEMWGVKGGWRIGLTNWLPFVSRLSKKCGNLDLL